MHHRCVRRAARVRTVLAIARDRAVDDAVVQLAALFVAEPELGSDTRARSSDRGPRFAADIELTEEATLALESGSQVAHVVAVEAFPLITSAPWSPSCRAQ